MKSKRPHRSAASPARLLAAAALVAVVALQLWNMSSAAAGEYTVRQCVGSDHQGFSGARGILGGVDRVDFVTGCTSAASDTVGVHQDRSGRTMGEGVGGEYRWTAPSESLIIATRFTVRMKNANGIVTSPVGARQNGDGVFLDGGWPHDGSQVTANWRDPGDPLRWAAARLICRQASGCANQSSSTKAFITVFDTEFTLVDNTPPRMTPGGSLFQWVGDSNWHRGSTEARIDATDAGGGVSSMRVQVNGSWLDVGSLTCPGARGSFATSMAPCPASASGRQAFSTNASPFREGVNTVRFCADDYHTSDEDLLNQVCTYPANVWIDNQAPVPPIGLHAVGGSGWRSGNGFTFEWEEPGGQLAPITGGSYRLVRPDSGETVAEGTFQGRRVLGPLFVPAPDEYELEVRLRDSAGNLGSPAAARIRFDDRPPGDVAPEPPSGWISADELPLRQVIEKAEARGPSGVAGYALTVSDDGPELPCPSGLCTDPPLLLSGGAEDRVGTIPGLSEGSHWISAVAASGARVSSETPGSVEVKVDRTAPRVALGGVPGTWSNRPVTITAAATDALSGMAPKPDDDGRPETVIQAEGFTPYRVPGPSASFTVTAEGESVVRYWARDLAGNMNDGERGPDGSRRAAPGETLVRIDTEPPELRFLGSRDPSDPERVDLDFRDSASGPGRAEVSLRRIGAAGPFHPIPTGASEDGQFSARVPSDDLPAGSYELRATGSDRAGNTTTSDRTVDGSPMLLRLPLKRVTRLRVGLGKRPSRRVTARFGGRPTVRGRVSVAGTGLSAAPLRIIEAFDPGSHPSRRTRTVRADGTGRFAVKLRPGPSRTVRVEYDGDRTRTRRRSPALRIENAGRISFKLRPTRVLNRGHVAMKGRVARQGAVIPARGKLVAIQYFDPSRSKWRPVEVIRTRRNGSFRYRYRFRTIASAQRIIFRAVSLKEAGWPYLHSTSAARSVIVFPSR